MRAKASVAALLVLASFLAYAPVLDNGVVLDDQYMVADNETIRDLSQIPSFFVSTPPGEIARAFYRPVMFTSYTLDYALFGGNMAGFHAMNVLWHALAGWLVYLLLDRLLGGSRASVLGALIFALHPVQAEVVYLVNYRATTLAACFFFAAWLYYLHRRERAWSAGSLVLFALLYFFSIASKEIGITLPVALLLYDLLFAPDVRPRLAPYLACAGVVLAYALLRHFLCDAASDSYFGSSTTLRVVLAMLVVEAYAVLLYVWPANLATTYDSSYLPVPSTPFDPLVLLAFCVLAGLLWGAWHMRRRAPLVSFAIGFHFIALGPTYQIIRLPVLFGERFLYLPIFGFCLLVALGLRRLELSRPPLARVAWGAGLAVCILFALGDHARAYDWRDANSLWHATVAARPNSVQAHVGLATTLKAQHQCAEALPHYEFAIRGTDPRTQLARNVYGEATTCYSFTQDWTHARAVVERWLHFHPDDLGFRAMLAQIDRVDPQRSR